MKKAVNRVEPRDVDSRLRELALDRESVNKVVQAAVGGWTSCTDFDPRGARGYESYRMGTRRIREVLVPQGWITDSQGGLESVLHEEKRLRLIFLNADEGAGRIDVVPQNRCRKGANSESVAQTNESMSLFEPGELYVPAGDGLESGQDDYATWHLCVHIASPTLVRAEVAMLCGFSSGYFTGFIEKIIFLGNGDWNDSFRKPPPGDDFDQPEVVVSRK